MTWALHHVALSAPDLARARWFFGELIGLTQSDGQGSTAQFGADGRGLHLIKPVRALSASSGRIMQPANARHLAITVQNLNMVAANLDRASVSYVEEDAAGSGHEKSIITLDPSMNLVQFVQASSEADCDGDQPWEEAWGWGVHHVNLQVADVREGVAFFNEMAGMAEGPWHVPETMGDVSIDPAQLALLPLGDDNRGLHLNRPDATFSLRNGFAHNPTIGGHPAFWVKDVKAVMERFDKSGIEYTDAGVYAMPHMHQIYVLDLAANFIEVNQYV